MRKDTTPPTLLDEIAGADELAGQKTAPKLERGIKTVKNNGRCAKTQRRMKLKPTGTVAGLSSRYELDPWMPQELRSSSSWKTATTGSLSQAEYHFAP